MRKTFFRYILTQLLLLVLLCPAGSGYAQDQNQDTVYTTTDSTEVEYEEDEEDYIPSTEDEKEVEGDTEIEPVIRTFSTDSLMAIKSQPEFLYMGYLDSLLRAEQKIKDNKVEEEVVYDPQPSLWDSSLVVFICWAVAIGLVAFVLFKLFLGQGVFFRNKSQELPAVDLEDMPDESDLEKALQQAIRKSDYRMATRYLFLITLSRLGEKGILQLSTEKTNYQYATELAGKSYANRFAQLSLQYEYVWFGGFAINEKQFATLQQQHQQFLKEV